MRSSRWARVAVACAAVAGLIVACVDQDSFIGPGRDTRLALAPHFVESSAPASAPIVRIRLAAIADGVVLGSLDDDDIDPSASFWELDLPIDLSGGPASVMITVEMLNADSVVEWSGRIGPLELSPERAPETVPVPVVRGPLDNLDVTGVVIATADTMLTEGDSLQLAASVVGGGSGSVIFWNTSDAARATVSANGVVRAHLPDSALIIAVAGAHEDTFRLGIRQRIAAVALTPDTLHFNSLGEQLSIDARVVDARGVTVSGRGGVTWSVADTSIARHLGGGLFEARAVGETTVTASADSALVAATAHLIVNGDPLPAPACSDAPRATHSGVIATSQTWTRDASPHLVSGTVYIDSAAVITIEPGAVICGESFAYLQFRNGARLNARGTALAPILFSAADTTAPWGGIYLDGAPADSSWISDATLEYARHSNGVVYAYDTHPVVLENLIVRHSQYAALYVRASRSVLRNIAVTDLRTTGYYAVLIGGTGNVVQNVGITDVAGTALYVYGTATAMTDIVIARAGGDGIYLSGTGHSLADARIEDVAGIGINSASSGDHLAAASGVRVIGSGSYGFRAGIADLALIAPTVADQDSLRGNARDTLVVTGGYLRGRTLEVRSDLPWRLDGYIYVDSAATLRVQPGAHVYGSTYAQLYMMNGGSLDARGTAAQPITFTSDSVSPWYGITVTSSTPDTSRVSHALIEFSMNTAPLEAYNQHALLVDSVRVRHARYSAAVLYSSGSRLRFSTIDTTHTPAYAAVTLAGGVTFEQNVIRGSAGAGVAVSGNDVSLLGGRIEGSAGPGIDFTSGYQVRQGAPIRVVGGASYPARLSVSGLARMYPDAASQDSLLGNASDTIVVNGGFAYGDTAYARADLPWRVQTTVYFDSASALRVQPGGKLHVAGGSYVEFRTGSSLQAIGTAAQPVTFTSVVPGTYWGGLYFSEAPADTSRIVHGLIEYGGSGGYAGVYATSAHVIRVDSTRIRASQYRAVYLGAPGSSLGGVTIDSTTIASYPAVELGSNTRIVASTIRGAAGVGLQLSGTNITVLGGRIEGSGGVGIYAAASQSLAAGSVSPRITGGLAHPVRVGIQPFAALFPSAAAQDSIVGNAQEGALITGGFLYRDTTFVRADLPWRVESTIYFDSASALYVQPGGTMAVDGGSYVEFRTGGTLQALGTAAQPVRFTATVPGTYWGGLYFSEAGADTSRIVHALIEYGGAGGYGGVYASSPHVVRVDSTRIRASQYRAGYLAGAGSSLRGVVIDTTVISSYPALELTSNVALDGVTVRGAAGTGVVYSGQPTTALRLNVFGAGSIAAQMTPRAVWQLGAVEDDTLSGNAVDRIRVTGGIVAGGTHYLRASLPWQLAGGVSVDSAARLVADPGAAVYAESGYLEFRSGGYLEALGTSTQPVRFTSSDGTNRWNGLRFYNVPADTSLLRHVRVEYAQDGGSGAIYGDASHVMMIDSSAVVRSYYIGLYIQASGSRVRETLVDTTISTSGYFAATLNNDVGLDGLTVRAAASHGFDHNGTPSTPLRVNVYDAGGLAGEVTPTAAARLTEVEDDTLSGNAVNRLRLSGGTLSGLDLTLRPSVPFGLNGSVSIDAGARLVSQPGGSVRAESGSFQFQNGGYLEAIGTAAEPILFTSSDGTNRWNGLRFYNVGADTSVMRHVRVEYAQDGGSGAIYGDASHVILLDSSAVVRSYYIGLYIQASGSLVRETLVDTTISTSGYFAASFGNDVGLDGLTLRAPASHGLDHNGDPSTPLRVNVYDAGGLAGEVTPIAAARMTQMPDDSISGNGSNWMRITGGTVTGLPIYMRPSLPLGLNGGVTVGAGASVVGFAGGRLHAESGSITFSGGGYLSAVGSSAQPIVFTSSDGTNRWNGLRFQDVGADTSRLRNVRVEYAQDGGSGAIYGTTAHPLELDSVVVERSTYIGIRIGAGSLDYVTVDTTLSAGYDAIDVDGPVTLNRVRVREAATTAIRTDAAGVTITNCELIGSGTYGLYVAQLPSGVSITNCNLVGTETNNAVHNVQNTAGTVNATNNYWGGGAPALNTPNGYSNGVDPSSHTTTPFAHTFPQ